MIDFLGLRWDREDEAACLTAAHLVRIAMGHGGDGRVWTAHLDRPGLWLASASRRKLPGQLVLADGMCAIFGLRFTRTGRVFDDREICDRILARDGFRALCVWLTRERWGAYVAISHDPADPARVALYRDPIGAIDCATWRSNGVRVVTSCPGRWLAAAPPVFAGIDWRHLAALLAFPGLVRNGSPLTGVDVAPAGMLTTLPASTPAERLWTPGDWCPPRRRTDAAPDVMQTVVADAISAWSSIFPNAVAEVSGGLDSAIVAAVARPAAAFHFSTTHRSGDERRDARGVASRLGLNLIEAIVAPDPLDAETLAAIPLGFRPGLGSTSLFHDRQLSQHLKASGATALFTGQGGDAVFFQPATPLVACDPAGSGAAGGMAGLLEIASWTRMPLTTIVRHRLFARWIAGQAAVAGNGVDYLAVAADQHALGPLWHGQLDGLAPAKRIHLIAISNMQSAFGSSWCGEVADVVHPLMSQPVIEHVLGLSARTLVQGRRDRALVRLAFADQLPASLVHRRGKGSLTAHFGLMLTRSLPVLRDHLLDGALAAAGLIDRRRLEAVLDTDHLTRFDPYAQLFATLLVERWARGWLEQLRRAETPPRHNQHVPRA